MKRDGFWREATPPVNILGVPLPFSLIYLLCAPFPSTTTFYGCTAVLVGFMALGFWGWSLKSLLIRLYCILRGANASGRP
ncbi:conjugal transfer protein, partial [Salmonella enterica subsp. enterica serovar Derby]|nr:conjugal transfer protein [Salmonella enterica subsp. enterica serovar Derby]